MAIFVRLKNSTSSGWSVTWRRANWLIQRKFSSKCRSGIWQLTSWLNSTSNSLGQ